MSKKKQKKKSEKQKLLTTLLIAQAIITLLDKLIDLISEVIKLIKAIY